MFTTDHIAVVGYSLLLSGAVYELKRSPANVLFIIGLISLIAYYISHLQTGMDETNNKQQKALRLFAHSTITAFLLLTLSSFSAAKFQFHHWFALLGHSILFVTVVANMSQIVGIVSLAIFFIFGTVQNIGASGMGLLNLAGCAMLMVFFILAALK